LLVLWAFGIISKKARMIMKLDFEKEIALRNELIASLEREGKLKDKLIRGLEKNISLKDDVITALTQESEIKNGIIEVQTRQIESLESSNNNFKKLIEDMLKFKPGQKG
jgi:hypothetical protein